MIIAISIHTPLARCDRYAYPLEEQIYISIHTPLARCDPADDFILSPHENFNPHTSCEVRPRSPVPRLPANGFQSTHLLRGATISAICSFMCFCISIHTPLARCDSVFSIITKERELFQSTHLLRGATAPNAVC